MKEKKLFLKILTDLFYTWSRDAPPEAVWIANDLLKFYEKEFGIILGEFEEDGSNFDQVLEKISEEYK